ncbi:hypothetical protein HNQ56_003162 [Anaerotaenia torta]
MTLIIYNDILYSRREWEMAITYKLGIPEVWIAMMIDWLSRSVSL